MATRVATRPPPPASSSRTAGGPSARAPALPPASTAAAARESEAKWLGDLSRLLVNAERMFGDVSWKSEEDGSGVRLVWAHKAIVYARAAGAFQQRYLLGGAQGNARPEASESNLSLVRASSPMSINSSTSTIQPPISLGGTDPAVFGMCLEYLYTGDQSAEVFTVLFDGFDEGVREGEVHLSGVDKLRQDLLYCWRSKLYADVTLTLDDPSQTSFSSHRAILSARSPYFHSLLLGNYSDSNEHSFSLPSGPFTPASTTFVLGYIYTGSLTFGARKFDLQTAFEIWRCADFLSLSLLRDEVTEKIEGMVNLARAGRVYAFALAPDVNSQTLARAASRFVVHDFGETWAGPHIGNLDFDAQKHLIKEVCTRLKADTVVGVAKQALFLRKRIELEKAGWASHIESMVEAIEDDLVTVISRNLPQVVRSQAFVGLIDGVGFSTDVLESIGALVIRGLTEAKAPEAYQALVGSVLLREEGILMDAKVLVEDCKLGVGKYIKRKWMGIRAARGFDQLEPWCLKELSDEIEVPVEELLAPTTKSSISSRSVARSTPSRITTSAPTLTPKPKAVATTPRATPATSTATAAASTSTPVTRTRQMSAASTASRASVASTATAASRTTIASTVPRGTAPGVRGRMLSSRGGATAPATSTRTGPRPAPPAAPTIETPIRTNSSRPTTPAGPSASSATAAASSSNGVPARTRVGSTATTSSRVSRMAAAIESNVSGTSARVRPAALSGSAPAAAARKPTTSTASTPSSLVSSARAATVTPANSNAQPGRTRAPSMPRTPAAAGAPPGRVPAVPRTPVLTAASPRPAPGSASIKGKERATPATGSTANAVPFRRPPSVTSIKSTTPTSLRRPKSSASIRSVASVRAPIPPTPTARPTSAGASPKTHRTSLQGSAAPSSPVKVRTPSSALKKSEPKPPGTSLLSGIPCIVTIAKGEGGSKATARFRAKVRYIGAVLWDAGQWVGVEVSEGAIPAEARELEWNEGRVDNVEYFSLSKPTSTSRGSGPVSVPMSAEGSDKGSLSAGGGASLRPPSRRARRSASAEGMNEAGPWRGLFVRPAQIVYVL